MKKLIAYDLDGTLADTREDIVLAVQHMLSELEAPARSPQEIISYVGSGLHELVRKSLGSDDMKMIEAGSKIYKTHYGKHMMDHTLLYPGASDVLKYFDGRVQAVITNKPDPFTRRMLEALGVLSCFKYVIPGNGRFPKKPDPASLFHIMKSEGIEPAEALFVGDSVVDLETGRAASVQTVILTHGFNDPNELKSRSPDFLAGGFDELLNISKTNHW